MDIRLSLFWACAAIIGIAELLILRAALFPTSDPPLSAPTLSAPNADAHQAASDVMPDIPQSPRAIEIVWGILPAFALGALLWSAWRALQ